MTGQSSTQEHATTPAARWGALASEDPDGIRYLQGRGLWPLPGDAVRFGLTEPKFFAAALRDATGRIVNFQRRSIGPEKRFGVISGAPVKGTCFGILAEAGPVWIVEGLTDGLAASMLGSSLGVCAVGIPRTSNAVALVEARAPQLRGRKVYVSLDNDPSGEAPAAQTCEALQKAGAEPHRARYPAGFKDLAEIVEKLGAERARGVVQGMLAEANRVDVDSASRAPEAGPGLNRNGPAGVEVDEGARAWVVAFGDECSAIEREGSSYSEAKNRLVFGSLLGAPQKFHLPGSEIREQINAFLARRFPEEHEATANVERPKGERHLTISWDEFVAETYPAVPSLWGSAFLVKGGGYLIVSGDTGVGKTILQANLILSLAEGRDDFLGFPLPGRPVRVLLLEAEGSRQLFRDRLVQIATNRGIRGSLPISFLARGAEPSIGQLGQMLEESKAEYAFLDPVGRFHSGNENDTTDWRACVTNPIAKLSADLDAAISFADHYSKPNENRSGQHKVRGSAAKLQDCGAAMRLEVGQGGKSTRILFFDRVRDGALPFPDRDPARMPLTIDLVAGTIAVDERDDAEMGTTAEPRLDDVATLVKKLEASSVLGKVSTASLRLAIESNLELSKSRATDLISAATSAGKICSAGRGYYRTSLGHAQMPLEGDPT